MDVAALNRMIANHAALRRRQRLQPVGGKGDKLFSPTYPGEGQTRRFGMSMNGAG
jgi:CRISPR-associated protein Csb1